jgi:hypothetical protein
LKALKPKNRSESEIRQIEKMIQPFIDQKLEQARGGQPGALGLFFARQDFKNGPSKFFLDEI